MRSFKLESDKLKLKHAASEKTNMGTIGCGMRIK